MIHMSNSQIFSVSSNVQVINTLITCTFELAKNSDFFSPISLLLYSSFNQHFLELSILFDLARCEETISAT